MYLQRIKSDIIKQYEIKRILAELEARKKIGKRQLAQNERQHSRQTTKSNTG